MSVRSEHTDDGEVIRILLRMRSGTAHRVISTQSHGNHTPAQLARVSLIFFLYNYNFNEFYLHLLTKL
jgi:hypothetical protein